MSMMLYSLSVEQKFQLLIFHLIILGICGILYVIKVKYENKIDNCKSRLIKRIFEEF